MCLSTLCVIRLPGLEPDIGVREPRHPKPPELSGAVELPTPDADEDG
jgi:hypothetical protein